MLIAGTALGTGILALPLSSASAGLLPSFAGLLVIWLAQTYAAFCLLELCLKLPEPGGDFYTVVCRYCRPGWARAFSAIYLTLLYSLTAMYVTVGAEWLGRWLGDSSISFGWASAFSALIFAGLIGGGVRLAGGVNALLTLGLLLIFCASVVPMVDDVQISNILHFGDVGVMFWALPVFATSFGFSVVMPAICDYLERDSRDIRSALWLGSFIVLAIYLLWDLVAFGILGGEDSQLAALAGQPDRGSAVVLALGEATGEGLFGYLLRMFVCCCLLTSGIGVFVALKHFVTSVVSNPDRKKWQIFALTFFPGYLVAIWFEAGLESLLGFAGIFVAISLGVFPVGLVELSRRNTERSQGYQVAGSPIIRLVAIGLFAFVIFAEVEKFLRG